ncbi:MAG: hypothetical protein LBT24_01540 [Tannerella sp.]|jgi:hypothetical protein|nr:hypothetical protein [Tannerella sp.]
MESKKLELFEKKSYEIDRFGGINTELSNKFNRIIEKSINLLLPFNKYEEIPVYVAYFTIDGDDCSEYDCCDNEECAKKTYEELKEDFPEAEVIEEYSRNDSDRNLINYCHQCGVPLNDTLTWVNCELEEIESAPEWDASYLKSEAFTICCILESLPSCDIHLTSYDKKNKLYDDFFKKREEFYQRILKLATAVNKQLK